jgi:hypothetical protein
VGKRRRERISRARAIPSKSIRRNEVGQRETRNSKKTHYGSLGDSVTDTSRGLAIADGTELRTSRGVHRRKILTSKKRLMLPQFQISQRKYTTDCSRPK